MSILVARRNAGDAYRDGMVLFRGSGMAKVRDQTSLGGEARAFPPTEWTRLLKCPQEEAVLAELCQRYWRPVYCYLRGMRLDNEEAKDLAQGFFTDAAVAYRRAFSLDPGLREQYGVLLQELSLRHSVGR